MPLLDAGKFVCLMSSLILLTMDNGGRQVVALKFNAPIPSTDELIIIMYAIKQIKVCAGLGHGTKASAVLLGTPGVWPTASG